MNGRGYTLVELVVVMAIMAALLGISMTYLVRARRTQEVDALNEQILDMVRRARNSSISVEETARVYGVRFLDEPGTGSDRVEYWRYPSGCGTGGGNPVCNNPAHRREVINLGVDHNMRIETIRVTSNNFGGGARTAEIPEGNEIGIYFSSPFGRGCTRTNVSNSVTGTGLVPPWPSSVTQLIDKDYPINFTTGNTRNCTPYFGPSGSVPHPTDLYDVEVQTASNDATLTIRKSIRFNMFSGDVSSL